jgi:hypothetical protein
MMPHSHRKRADPTPRVQQGVACQLHPLPPTLTAAPHLPPQAASCCRPQPPSAAALCPASPLTPAPSLWRLTPRPAASPSAPARPATPQGATAALAQRPPSPPSSPPCSSSPRVGTWDGAGRQWQRGRRCPRPGGCILRCAPRLAWPFWGSSILACHRQLAPALPRLTAGILPAETTPCGTQAELKNIK